MKVTKSVAMEPFSVIKMLPLRPSDYLTMMRPAGKPYRLMFATHLAVAALRENADWGSEDLSRTGGPYLADLIYPSAGMRDERGLEVIRDERMLYVGIQHTGSVGLVPFERSGYDGYNDWPIFKSFPRPLEAVRRDWLLWTHWLNAKSCDLFPTTYRQLPYCTQTLQNLLDVERLIRPHHQYTVANLIEERPAGEKLAIAILVMEEMEGAFQKTVQTRLGRMARISQAICSASGLFHP